MANIQIANNHMIMYHKIVHYLEEKQRLDDWISNNKMTNKTKDKRKYSLFYFHGVFHFSVKMADLDTILRQLFIKRKNIDSKKLSLVASILWIRSTFLDNLWLLTSILKLKFVLKENNLCWRQRKKRAKNKRATYHIWLAYWL